jgi:3-oxoadipate enol-lactonase
MDFSANGIRIRAEVRGTGPWLVMSHSLACSHAMWDAQIERYSAQFRVLAFDTRGHGGTDAPAGPYTLDQLADDLQALLDAAGIDRCHYVGLSMGGMIGMTHALKYPGRLQTLALCDTSSRIPAEARPVWQSRIDLATQQGMEPLVTPTLERWFTEGFRKGSPEAVARVAGMIRATPVAGYVGCCQAIAPLDITDRLGAIGVPTLVLVGDRDVGTPVEASRAIHQAIAGSHLGVIPSASHLSNIEQPEVFDFLLGRFLAAHR